MPMQGAAAPRARPRAQARTGPRRPRRGRRRSGGRPRRGRPLWGRPPSASGGRGGRPQRRRAARAARRPGLSAPLRGGGAAAAFVMVCTSKRRAPACSSVSQPVPPTQRQAGVRRRGARTLGGCCGQFRGNTSGAARQARPRRPVRRRPEISQGERASGRLYLCLAAQCVGRVGGGRRRPLLCAAGGGGGGVALARRGGRARNGPPATTGAAAPRGLGVSMGRCQVL